MQQIHTQPVQPHNPSTAENPDQFFTLESSPASSICAARHDSAQTPFSEPYRSSATVAEDAPDLRQRLRELEMSLLGPDTACIHSGNGSCCPFWGYTGAASSNLLGAMIPGLDLRKVLVACAKAVGEEDLAASVSLMEVLGHMVSVSGNPFQRLAAYILEGLRARVERSGGAICSSLSCREPPGKEMMSYMHVMYQICPYWKFAYLSANAVIEEAVRGEGSVHIVDFQIGQGTQWVEMVKRLSERPGGPPALRISGMDDVQSAYARDGGLRMVGSRLEEVAGEWGVGFQFCDVGVVGGEVDAVNIDLREGEAVVVNFPYFLHHVPDQSVSSANHRDRILRLVRSMSPKVVVVAEQECDTNTAAFLPRFMETLEYYAAMFESIDVARPRDDRQRISAEQHCVARDVVNILACEGAERVERHEPIGKWRARLTAAGFKPHPLCRRAVAAVHELMAGYSQNYRLVEHCDVLYLGWISRPLATSSAWNVEDDGQIPLGIY